jgi:hypothetical protein
MIRGNVPKLIATPLQQKPGPKRHDGSPKLPCTSSRRASFPIGYFFRPGIARSRVPDRGLALRRQPSLAISAPDANHCQRTVQPKASSYQKAVARQLGHASNRTITRWYVASFSLLAIDTFHHDEVLYHMASCALSTRTIFADSISSTDETSLRSSMHHRSRTCRLDCSGQTARKGH